ncbi:MAG: DUF3710 domain-containing protein [Actinomycetota bacterium]|nr:DUF3710 domain-containing protein [Actinomycetota bacterium]
MGIFRRGRRADVADEELDGAAAVEGEHDVEPADAVDAAGGTDGTDEEGEERYARIRGPFDATEVDDDVERIDLGALRIAPLDGMQLRLELDQEQQAVVSAHALLGDSAVQLQAYAAPRTLGVWPDIRTEIAQTVTAQGGTADVVPGPLGRELVARIPGRGPDGRAVHNQVRFLGVDGPRWFLRAVISGPAATDEAKAAPLLDLVRSVVVVRDDEARPPREALPLRVPTNPAPDATPDQPAEVLDDQERAHEDETSPARSAEDLRPFERGPEITEVR